MLMLTAKDTLWLWIRKIIIMNYSLRMALIIRGAIIALIAPIPKEATTLPECLAEEHIVVVYTGLEVSTELLHHSAS